MSDQLFVDLDRRPAADRPNEGAPRYETVNRAQVELYPCDLESLLPPGHAARLVWRFVEGLDLSGLYATIRAREGGAGRSAIDPKILVALWLYATIDGVGSARELDRLSTAHDAYRWLRGGVSVNYHTLSDFRVDHGATLDALLTQSITALLHRGVVTLARVAHDGTRVRASAGVGSFRRAKTLQACLRAAQHQVERTARQEDGAASARVRAADARAARERLAHVEQALAELPQVEAIKAKQARKRPTVARVSTTDPEARVMKLGDGGYAPAYNIQFGTDVASRAIVGVQVTNIGTERGALVPMLDEIARRTGQLPGEHLVDGGFFNQAAVTTAAARGVTLYTAVKPAAARRDTPAVTALRARMATDEGQRIYRDRASTAEWVNADARTHRVLDRIPVRGLKNVHAWVLWIALAHNMMRLMAIVPHLMT